MPSGLPRRWRGGSTSEQGASDRYIQSSFFPKAARKRIGGQTRVRLLDSSRTGNPILIVSPTPVGFVVCNVKLQVCQLQSERRQGSRRCGGTRQFAAFKGNFL